MLLAEHCIVDGVLHSNLATPNNNRENNNTITTNNTNIIIIINESNNTNNTTTPTTPLPQQHHHHNTTTTPPQGVLVFYALKYERPSIFSGNYLFPRYAEMMGWSIIIVVVFFMLSRFFYTLYTNGLLDVRCCKLNP